MNSYEKGIFYEKAAYEIIKKQNLRIIATRLKNKFGEIDCLAKKNNNYYIFEVKYRESLEKAAYTINKEQAKRSMQVFYEYSNRQNLKYDDIYYIALLVSKKQFRIINCHNFEIRFD